MQNTRIRVLQPTIKPSYKDYTNFVNKYDKNKKEETNSLSDSLRSSRTSSVSSTTSSTGPKTERSEIFIEIKNDHSKPKIHQTTKTFQMNPGLGSPQPYGGKINSSTLGRNIKNSTNSGDEVDGEISPSVSEIRKLFQKRVNTKTVQQNGLSKPILNRSKSFGSLENGNNSKEPVQIDEQNIRKFDNVLKQEEGCDFNDSKQKIGKLLYKDHMARINQNRIVNSIPSPYKPPNLKETVRRDEREVSPGKLDLREFEKKIVFSPPGLRPSPEEAEERLAPQHKVASFEEFTASKQVNGTAHPPMFTSTLPRGFKSASPLHRVEPSYLPQSPVEFAKAPGLQDNREESKSFVPPPPPPPPMPNGLSKTVNGNPGFHSLPKPASKAVNLPNPKTIDRFNPEIKKLAYGQMRNMYSANHERANRLVSTLPKDLVRKDNGVKHIIDSMAKQGSLGQITGRANPKPL